MIFTAMILMAFVQHGYAQKYLDSILYFKEYWLFIKIVVILSEYEKKPYLCTFKSVIA